jgi:hypothetical protein
VIAGAAAGFMIDSGQAGAAFLAVRGCVLERFTRILPTAVRAWALARLFSPSLLVYFRL